MCLIIFAWKVVPGLPLIAVANRDEYYARPSSAAAWWQDSPNIYAGRDLQAGGTWLGVTRDGRFAALTNVRAPHLQKSDAPSRGLLVSNYLRSDMTPAQYIACIDATADTYNGFNLVLGNRDTLLWFSNQGRDAPLNGQALPSGIYGLSNALLDTPWPKVTRAKAQFSSLLCQGAPEDTFFEMLRDNTRANDCRLPQTGISLERERVLSSVFITSPDYGTRALTLVKIPASGEPLLSEQLIDPATQTDIVPPVTDPRPHLFPCKLRSEDHK